jgi:DNA-binding NtrC family response regulator
MSALATNVDDIKTHAPELPHATERRGCRVLVVDDDPSMLRFVNVALVAAGSDTTLASDGPDALMTSETNGPFDVLLTDVMMPQMRGEGLAHRVRQRNPATKILYLTGRQSIGFSPSSLGWIIGRCSREVVAVAT